MDAARSGHHPCQAETRPVASTRHRRRGPPHENRSRCLDTDLASARWRPHLPVRSFMSKRIASADNPLRLIAVIILVAGWLGALVVYLAAADETGHALIYEFGDGSVHAVDPGDSKMYRHELERFGGKAAVLADDLNRWFSSLWRGKRLAITVAFLSAALALLVFRAGRTPRKGKGDTHEP